jgi:hypothetical protein
MFALDKVPAALAAQNTGSAWLDCNAADRPHRWRRDIVTGDRQWWRCARCPVSTRTHVEARPGVFLGTTRTEWAIRRLNRTR